MRKLLAITAYNRPDYLQPVLESWAAADLADWDIEFRLEPSDPYMVSKQVKMFEEILAPHVDGEASVVVNPVRLGVLLHPWVVLEDAFERGFDFVVRAEDDLLVSRDILRYFDYAAQEFEDDPDIATVHAYSRVTGGRFEIRRGTQFSPLVWGTWADRWREYIGPTWDKDYSTNNGIPGEHAGWDWNLNERVLPRLGKHVIQIDQSRVQNIGVFGTHATPYNFEQAPQWEQDYGTGRYWTR